MFLLLKKFKSGTSRYLNIHFTAQKDKKCKMGKKETLRFVSFPFTQKLQATG